jgi:ribosomal protein L37AE/L43A
MDAWLSECRPVLSLVFDYLELSDLQKWRIAGKFAEQYSDASLKPKQWQEIVETCPAIDRCSTCHSRHMIKKMFGCPTCRKYACGLHVVACQMCLFEMCERCARSGGCNSCLCHPSYY